MRTDMNSRQWANPDTLFDVFVTLTYSPEDSKDVRIDSITPPTYDAEDILNQIPKFAYPCKYNSPSVEHYTFVLTDVEAKFHYGFCRFSHDQHHIICLLSRLPWFDVFYLLLNKISELSSAADGERQVRELLDAVYNTEVPAANEPCVVLEKSPTLTFKFDGPDYDKLASIPDNRNLNEYYCALDPEMMITVFASMLNERRILITSRRLGKLTACCHAAASLLYPCYWQHLFIPVLPEAVLEFVLAPMPYIIGVQQGLMDKVKAMDLDDAVILNVDDGTMTTQHDDRLLLPSEAVSSLRKALKSPAQDDSISRAFLRCLVKVIGGYRNGLQYPDGNTITFDEEVYISAATSSSERSWREIVTRMQYFSQFIDDRLVMLNSGKGFQDEFENEMTNYSSDKNNGVKYKEWLSTMKKQGKKFKNKGQHTFFHLGRKVQDTTKKAYKDVRSRLDEKLKRDKDYSIIDKGNSHYILKEGEKTSTAPRTIVSTPLRPSRPPRPQNFKEQSPTEPKTLTSPKRQSYNKALKYRTLSLSEEDLPSIPSLMNDPDLQGLLYGKSFSAVNVNHPYGESNNNSTSSKVNSLQSSSSLSPIPPPRRKRSEQLLALSSTDDVSQVGQENEGFSDNFTSILDDLKTDNAEVLRRTNPTAPNATLLDTRDSTTAADSNARSSINDLIGLDLSPNKATASPQTQANTSGWSQNQPNYYVSASTAVNVPPIQGSTNPFVPAYTAAPTVRTDFRLSASSSSPALTAMSGNGQVHKPPARPPPPTLTPHPVNPQRQQASDPLANLRW